MYQGRKIGGVNGEIKERVRSKIIYILASYHRHNLPQWNMEKKKKLRNVMYRKFLPIIDHHKNNGFRLNF